VHVGCDAILLKERENVSIAYFKYGEKNPNIKCNELT
jgi:hypothetical protein